MGFFPARWAGHSCTCHMHKCTKRTRCFSCTYTHVPKKTPRKHSCPLPGDGCSGEDELRYDSPLTHWCWQSAPKDESPELPLIPLGGFSVCLRVCVTAHICVCETNVGSQRKRCRWNIFTLIWFNFFFFCSAGISELTENNRQEMHVLT